MDYADFVHLARTSEQACEEDRSAYRRSVIWFAALGYLWVIGFVLLALGLLVYSLMQVFGGRFGFVWITLVFTACGLLWVSLRALRLHFDPPSGVRLSPDDSPELFKSLERIQRRIKGPPIHEVYLNDDFNASVSQVPRWGVLGGSINRLTLGLPMMMALDKRRMLSVLAHEYGHLRGEHGRLGAWVYRTRESWRRLDESMEDSASPFAVATHAFLRWYSPRFVARTFAMARQEEYEADRVAAKLLGREEIAAALVESEVKSVWLDTRFWELHWALALREPSPVGPFESMQRLLAQEPEAGFAKATLRRALQSISSVADTHPVLRDRVAALGEKRPRLPDQWSERGSLSLLGAAGSRWRDYFDRQWCKDNADAWKLHHGRLQRARARVLELQSSNAHRSVAEQVETAGLVKLLNPTSSMSTAMYRQALERDPVHAQALIGMVQSVVESDPERCLQYLERLWNHHPTHRLWASRMAVQELESPREGREFQDEALKQWRERRREAERTEADVLQELHRSAPLESVKPHELSAFELAEIRAELSRVLPVREAWILRKEVRSMPDRRAHLLLVTITRAEDSAKSQLCEELANRIDLQGMVLVLPMERAASRDQLAQLAGEPVFVRAA